MGPDEVAAKLYRNSRAVEAHLMAMLSHVTREASEGRTWDCLAHDEAVIDELAAMPRATRELQIETRHADGVRARRLVRVPGVALSVVVAGDWHRLTAAERSRFLAEAAGADACVLQGWA